MPTRIGPLGRMVSGAVFFLLVSMAVVPSLAARSRGVAPAVPSPGQLRPELRRSWRRSFPAISCKPVPAEAWFSGLLRFHRSERTRMSSYLDSSAPKTAGLPPLPIAESSDLERSPAIWIDGGSGAVHAAWVENEQRRSRGAPQ